MSVSVWFEAMEYGVPQRFGEDRKDTNQEWTLTSALLNAT